ncbi:MAG: tRNA epoxyqueuosine(34) reductase QueG [Oligoflexia bacterium]|nr:tRNA epoxyqueuosine(34) reductase QueG [Oligoflexia bacterium]
MNRLELHPLLLKTARRHGFPLAGALDITAAPLEAHVARYDDWLSRGPAGTMEYLVRGRDRRADPKLVFPEARSVLCVGQPYSARGAGPTDPAQGPRYARYLRSGDYHTELARRLEEVLREVRGARPELASLRWKVCVDTSAVLERSWAMLAGLGWIGKNTLLIHPRYGSYFLLGIALLNHETGHGPAPLPDYCGRCTRCLDACPSRALTEPHVLDSRRCIAYVTLEKRGEIGLSEADRRTLGRWVAGCDLCQEVCPFNIKPTKAPVEQPEGALSVRLWRELLEESPETYRARTRGSALDRVKPAQFSRNLAIALANTLLTTEDQGLRELEPLVRERTARETDATARAEWDRCQALFHSPKRTP